MWCNWCNHDATQSAFNSWRQTSEISQKNSIGCLIIKGPPIPRVPPFSQMIPSRVPPWYPKMPPPSPTTLMGGGYQKISSTNLFSDFSNCREAVAINQLMVDGFVFPPSARSVRLLLRAALRLGFGTKILNGSRRVGKPVWPFVMIEYDLGWWMIMMSYIVDISKNHDIREKRP